MPMQPRHRTSPSLRPAPSTFRRAVADPSLPSKRHHFDLMLRTFLEFFGPFDVPCKRSDLRSDAACAAPSHPLGYLPSSAASSRFRTSSTLSSAPAARPCFMPVPSLGFHPFEGFSPRVAPRTSRLPVSSLPFLPLARARLRGCQHHPGALTSLRVFSADEARSSLGRSPLRGLDLHGLAPRFREAPLMGFSGSVRAAPRPSLGR